MNCESKRCVFEILQMLTMFMSCQKSSSGLFYIYFYILLLFKTPLVVLCVIFKCHEIKDGTSKQ